jgi:hypothetical protein
LAQASLRAEITPRRVGNYYEWSDLKAYPAAWQGV